MKKKITILSILSVFAIVFIASDHIDSPAITRESSDIADFYAFQGSDTDNIAFIVTVQGILDPVDSADANFDQNVITQINIDTNADNVEDLVIQSIRRGNRMWFFGPEKPTNTGNSIEILNDAAIQETVQITPYKSNQITKNSETGIKYFAGVTDDPFFFDIATFRKVKAGSVSRFNNPGDDTWGGLNVLSIAVEVPKSLLGEGETINTWASSYRKK